MREVKEEEDDEVNRRWVKMATGVTTLGRMRIMTIMSSMLRMRIMRKT